MAKNKIDDGIIIKSYKIDPNPNMGMGLASNGNHYQMFRMNFDKTVWNTTFIIDDWISLKIDEWIKVLNYHILFSRKSEDGENGLTCRTMQGLLDHEGVLKIPMGIKIPDHFPLGLGLICSKENEDVMKSLYGKHCYIKPLDILRGQGGVAGIIINQDFIRLLIPDKQSYPSITEYIGHRDEPGLPPCLMVEIYSELTLDVIDPTKHVVIMEDRAK